MVIGSVRPRPDASKANGTGVLKLLRVAGVMLRSTKASVVSAIFMETVPVPVNAPGGIVRVNRPHERLPPITPLIERDDVSAVGLSVAALRASPSGTRTNVAGPSATERSCGASLELFERGAFRGASPQPVSDTAIRPASAKARSRPVTKFRFIRSPSTFQGRGTLRSRPHHTSSRPLQSGSYRAWLVPALVSPLMRWAGWNSADGRIGPAGRKRGKISGNGSREPRMRGGWRQRLPTL